MKDLDLEAIRLRRKRAWFKEAEQKLAIQEKLALTVPWWLVIIAAGLFALSASHTVGVFSQFSPVGYAGPFVVEFGLLFVAFSRVSAKQSAGRLSGMLLWFERITFVMAVLANGVGATTQIAERTGISAFSLEALVRQFGALPLTVQLEVLFLPAFALFVPIGTWVVGEGLARLVLLNRVQGNFLEEQWREVEQEEMRRALYAEFVHHMTSQEAKIQSEAMSAGLVRGRARTPRTGNRKDAQPPSATKSNPPSVKALPDARIRVQEYLATNPDGASMSVRQLASAIGVSNRLAHEELTKWKQEHGQ